MDWIKGNGFAKVSLMIFLMLAVMGVEYVFGDVDLTSNSESKGKPYFCTSNSKWYSLYYYNQYDYTYLWTDEARYVTVYPPCKTSFGLKWHCSSTYGKFKVSVVGSDNSEETLFDVASNTYTSYPSDPISYNFTKANVTKVKYFRYNSETLHLYFRESQIELAPHVRIDDGSSTGTTDYTCDFGNETQASGTKNCTIYIRSFLTSHNLKMKVESESGDVTTNATAYNTFKIIYQGITYAQESPIPIVSERNICGYRDAPDNRTTSTTPAEPINTSLIPIVIQYNPNGHLDLRKAKLTIYDDQDNTISATVHLVANSEDHLSNGKPYYAQQLSSSGTGDWKWFSAYYSYTAANEPSTTEGNKKVLYSVYSPFDNSDAAKDFCLISLRYNATSAPATNNVDIVLCPGYKSDGTTLDESIWKKIKGVNTSIKWETIGRGLTLGENNPEVVPPKELVHLSVQNRNAGGTDFRHNNIQLPLAKHILFDNKSKHGTKDTTFTIPLDPTQLGQPVELPIPFRSFLVGGNMKIKMTSGDSNVFRMDGSSTKCTTSTAYTILANSDNKSLCGIKSDSAAIKNINNYEGSASHRVPGDASLLDFKILVYPTGTGSYTATFKVYDESDESNNYATVNITINVKSANTTDLVPSGAKIDDMNAGTFDITSAGKPYYTGNCWYSLYYTGPRTLVRRTITDLAVYPPCQGNLYMTFDKGTSSITYYTSQKSTRSGAALFAVGLNDDLQYTSTYFSDQNQNNDGTAGFVWNATDANSLSPNNPQTIVNFDNSYESYINTLYKVQIYNAIGCNIGVSTINLKLATHVRIDNGSVFGKNDTTIYCNKDNEGNVRSDIYVGETQTNSFKLRSFLTANTSGTTGLKMKIMAADGENDASDDLKNTFRIVYNNDTSTGEVPIETNGNKCGYPGADSNASGSPINTSNLPIGIQFCPATSGTHNATLVFYDNGVKMAKVHLVGVATGGALTFDNSAEDQNWFNVNNWKTKSGASSTKIPAATDEVIINATCTIPNCSTAVAQTIQFGESGSLSIKPQGVLNAENIINAAPEKLTLEASSDNSASVLFTSGGGDENSPKATVQCYFKGKSTPKGTTGDDANIMIPEWQYRGFIGNPDDTKLNESNMYIWLIKDVLYYKWLEKNNDGSANNCWDEAHPNQGAAAWAGFSMANVAETCATQVYTTTLIPTSSAHSIDVTRNTPTSGTNPRSGLNLLTNSFSAPVRINQLTFGENVLDEIVFFNTKSYKDVEDAKKTSSFMTSIYTTFPSISSTVISDNAVIPAGQSFFCYLSSGSSSTLTLPAPQHQASGAMYAPRVEEEFNVLKIYAESETERDEVYLVESDNCTHNYDNGYDGTKYFTSGMGQIYGKNEFGRTFIAADSSMLGQMIGFRAGSNDMTYTLRFDIDRLSGYDELYLYDRVTKRYVNILEGGTYEFNGTTEGEDERFQVIGRMEDSDSFITGSDHAIEVVGERALLRGFDGEDEVVYMTDLAGKVVWSDNAKNGPWFELPTNIASGLYVIHCGDVTGKYLKR